MGVNPHSSLVSITLLSLLQIPGPHLRELRIDNGDFGVISLRFTF